MKRLFINIALILTFGIGIAGCYEDIIKPDLEDDPEGIPKQVSFKNDLAPIFSQNCTLVGCHVAGAHKPYLTTDVSYQQIVNGGYVNTSLPKESILYQRVYGEMAEYIPGKADKQKVYDWIRNGAPNN